MIRLSTSHNTPPEDAIKSNVKSRTLNAVMGADEEEECEKINNQADSG